MDIPKGHEYCVDSTYYKVGLHHYVYMWNNSHWQKSAKTERELIHSKDKPLGNSNGNPTGCKPKAITKQRAILALIKDLGPLSKHDVKLMTGLSDSTVKHALRGLTLISRLVYLRRTKTYSLPVETQIDFFMRAAS